MLPSSLKQCPTAVYFPAKRNTSLETGLPTWWALFFESFSYLRCVEQLHKELVRLAPTDLQGLMPPALGTYYNVGTGGIQTFHLSAVLWAMLAHLRHWQWDEDLFHQPFFESPLPVLTNIIYWEISARFIFIYNYFGTDKLV